MRRLAALAALLALAAGCGGSSEPEQAAAPSTPTVAGPGSEITGQSLDGESLSLTDFRGKRVLVNVWSSW
jgi:hypothetical protein